MSDFLTTLAGRTMGAIPVVTPRRRSRFEPDSLSDSATFHEENAETIGRSLRAHSSEVPSTPRPPRSVASMAGNPPGTPHAPRAPVSATDLRPATAPSARADPASTKPLPTPVLTASKPNSSEHLASLGRVAPAVGLLTPRVARRDPPAPLRNESIPAPAIHVSIGRVEVRAIQRAEKLPAPAVEPTPYRSSLGSYLRGSRGPRE